MALQYTFVSVFDPGRLALSQRPKIKEIRKLKIDNCSRVVTVLGRAGENAHNIGAEVKAQGMVWDWIKVSTANNPSDHERFLIKSSSLTILDALKSGESVVIHCSAGLHRTGILAHCVLRNGGLTYENSLNVITKMRIETAQALQGKYLELAESLVVR